MPPACCESVQTYRSARFSTPESEIAGPTAHAAAKIGRYAEIVRTVAPQVQRRHGQGVKVAREVCGLFHDGGTYSMLESSFSPTLTSFESWMVTTTGVAGLCPQYVSELPANSPPPVGGRGKRRWAEMPVPAAGFWTRRANSMESGHSVRLHPLTFLGDLHCPTLSLGARVAGPRK